MKAVIMAGGSGTRLRPLTCDIPKPMVTILNRPVMEHIINLLKRERITDIAVTSYYLPQTIKDYFGNGEKWGVNLHYFQEKSPLGTAGSVQNASDFLDESFVVISGDAITDFNLNEAISFHREMEAEATLVLSRVEVPLDYGVVITDEKYRINSFLEKPGWSQVFSDTVNTGIYILDPVVFNYYKKGEKYDFSRDLFPLMLKADKAIYGLPLAGYWNDIGTIKDYYQTNRDFMLEKINLPFPECRQPAAGIWLEDGVKIADSAKIKAPVYIAQNTEIGEGVEIKSSVIGKNNIIKENTSIKDSISWDNNIISRNSEIRASVLADGVKLGESVRVYDRTVIGRLAKIGRHSSIKPGVKIWPEKIIGENNEVDKSIVAEANWQDSLFKEDSIQGKEKIDITADFIVRLAFSLSSYLPKDAELSLASDGSRLSRSYKLILAGALTSCGNNIIDMGEIIKPAFKYNIERLSLNCGVYISKNDKEEILQFSFYDDKGIIISEKSKKEIEKKYFTEKYRIRTGEIGEYSYLPGRYREYLKKLDSNINKEKIREKYFKIVFAAKENQFHPAYKLLYNLNCQILKKEISLQKRKNTNYDFLPDNADCHVKFKNDFSELVIFDDKKRMIEKPLLELLIAEILMDKGEKTIYLPLNYPRAIENYANSKDVQIRYTKANKREAVLKTYRDLNKRRENDSGFIYPYHDGLYSLLLILEKMAVENKKLSEIIDSLPNIYYQRAEIACSWNKKGKVMRILAEEAENKEDLIDGVRFEHDEGWALVLPDGEKAVFHVFVEGTDMETAESLSGFYLNKIKKIINEK